MTIIKQVDAAIQSAVDAAAFAIMRQFGCGKGPIRLGIYLSVVVTYLALAVIDQRPLNVISAFIWLLVAEYRRRNDVAAKDGVRSVNDLAHPWMKPFWLMLAAVCCFAAPAYALPDLVLLMHEYFCATPPTPPPSRETSRELVYA